MRRVHRGMSTLSFGGGIPAVGKGTNSTSISGAGDQESRLSSSPLLTHWSLLYPPTLSPHLSHRHSSFTASQSVAEGGRRRRPYRACLSAPNFLRAPLFPLFGKEGGRGSPHTQAQHWRGEWTWTRGKGEDRGGQRESYVPPATPRGREGVGKGGRGKGREGGRGGASGGPGIDTRERGEGEGN